ncbi:MAG: acyltransferase [Colwellia sp.]|nr:acyltransferase [Colwellia sp.]
MSNEYDYDQLKSYGDDVFISQNVEIRRPNLVTVGSHLAIDTGFYCTVTAEIGDYVHIAPYITVIGGAKGLFKMHHFSTIAAGSRVICGSDEHLGEGLVGPTIPKPYKDNIKYAPVILERYANVGTNVVIMPGVTIAEGCVIGSNSTVTKSTKPWTIYVGNPARAIKTRKKENILDYAKKLGY